MKKLLITALLIALASVQTVAAREMYAYPKKGQSAEQQSRDDHECFRWATQRTGYDPRRPTSSYGDTSGSTGKGILGGALLGAVVGGVADGKAGEGAAIGGLLGGVHGHSKGKEQQRTRAAGAQDSYNRAYKACMEARGYSVN